MDCFSRLQSLSNIAPFRVVLRAGVAAGIAAAANVALFLACEPILVTDGPTSKELAPVGIADVAAASLLPAIPAALFVLALRRFTAHPERVFTAVAVLIWVLSLVPVAMLPSSARDHALLVAMHTTSALAITIALVRGRR